MPVNAYKPVILIDGSSYLFRAFHALPPLTTAMGEPTGAIYGVANMIRSLLKEYKPDYVAVIFDAKGKNFRHTLYPDYKAHRPPMPAELGQQIPLLYELLQAMGLPLLIIDGVEADDVIGTLAHQIRDRGQEVLISTGDKDLAQLVDSHIRLINTMNNHHLDVPGVVDKFGVPPERIIDYLALIGDSSDNVPGIPKVGPKTAVKWLTQYGNVDSIIRHADEIGGKVGENLRANLEQLQLSRQLVTLDCDLSLDTGLDELRPQAANNGVLRELYTRLEFKRWFAELDNVHLGQSPLLQQKESITPVGADSDHDFTSSGHRATATNYETIFDEARLTYWIQRLEHAELFAFDAETTRLDYMQAEIVGLSFAITTGEAAYVPLAHNYPGAPEQLDRDRVLAQLKPLLEDPDQAKVGQNLKYVMNVLANYDIRLQGIAHDTMLESYVLDSTASRHDMDSLASKYLGRSTIHYEDVAGKGAKQLCFNQIAIEQAAPYAAEDADITLCLHQHLWPRLSQLALPRQVYKTLEIPLVSVLSRMERCGVLVNATLLNTQSNELALRMHDLEQQAHDIAGNPFNLNSPKQIQALLFDTLGLPVLAKTAKGQPSTAESVLQELALDYPLPKLLLEHRGLAKLKSTYTDKLPLQIDADSGRVHSSYHQAVTATGRLSCSDPNLQNIPIRTAEGRRIRQAFVAPSGYRLVAADYSQIELRIMAHLSADEGLLNAFAAGEDIHRATAAEIFAIDADKVDSQQRRSAKAINFGLIYGMSAFGLAKQLGIDRNAAQAYVNRYFERYPGVADYMEATRTLAREQGYVETVFGRRLYIPDINASNGQRRQYAERSAINAPMQGTAADIIKHAMIHIDRWIEGLGSDGIRMIMQVHDELVFEVPEAMVDGASEQISEHMMAAAELSVPLVVDIGVGGNWDEAH